MTTTVSYIIPTRNRSADLARTLAALGRLGPHEAEVLVIDNASATRPHLPSRLSSGVPVGLIKREHNDGAAARNAGARVAVGQWLVMLDDDSHPTCDADTLLAALERQPANVAAVMGDIHLPAQARRESGGLPEVFIGCGVAIRRDIFLDLEGYDPAFGFYGEEYDLSAKMLLDGLRIAFEPRFTVDHHKVAAGRDIDLILHRLVRNNGWVMQRYAPEKLRRHELRATRARYRAIAQKENALVGYTRGLIELRDTIRDQARREMPNPIFDRFTGLAAARAALGIALDHATQPRTAVLVDEGKNASVIREALMEHGIRVLRGTASPAEADIAVIGTMSPGPMIDAAIARRDQVEQGRVIVPWRMALAATNPARVPDRAAARVLPAA